MCAEKLKHILVTGGSGFVGSHLCERLLDLGYRVTCLDNLSTGCEGNIAGIRSHPHFAFIERDVSAPLSLDVDQIYNLACPASPKRYQSNPIYTLRTCVLGTENMLNLALKNNASLLQASTSEIYGDPTVHPQHEGYLGNVNPIGPRACYDEGKRCAETLCFDYKRVYNARINVARIFNTYGPRMQADDGRVVSNFLTQAMEGEPLTIYGKGEQTRSFCFVSDLVEGLIDLMHKGCKGPVNLGNPTEWTIKELADIVLKLTQSSSPTVYSPLPEDDPKCRQPDIALAKQELGWEPKVSLQAGLEETLNYFVRNRAQA